MAAEAQHAPQVRDRENAPLDLGQYPDHDLDDDTSGLMAWVDSDGTFNAVGADGVARTYGDGPDEGARLAADMAEPAAEVASLSISQRLRRLFAPVEPWYDWSADATILRLNTVERDFTDESEGRAFEFELQWFGLHFGVKFGRTPPAICPDLIAARKTLNARKPALTPFEIVEENYRRAQVAVSALRGPDSPEHARVTGAFLDAVTAIDATPVSTLEEFARSFIIAMDDGESIPSEEVLDRLFADARRLTTKGV